MRAAVEILRTTYQAWNDDHAQRLAAALAYYITFALAPFMIVVIQIAGLILSSATSNNQDVRGAILAIVAHSAGAATAQALDGIVSGTMHRQGNSVLAVILGWIVLVIAAGGLFGAIQDALNAVWNVPQRQGGIWALLRDRFVSFAMVGGIALLLIVSLLVNALATSLFAGLERFYPGFAPLVQIFGVAFTFVLTMLLVAMIYKWLPDISLRWRDVLAGAFITAILFGIGELALGWYLGRAGTTSAYGAAGSLVLILLWIYYSAQIFLLGAEFTKVLAAVRRADRVDPRRAA